MGTERYEINAYEAAPHVPDGAALRERLQVGVAARGLAALGPREACALLPGRLRVRQRLADRVDRVVVAFGTCSSPVTASASSERA